MRFSNWVHGVTAAPELTIDRMFKPDPNINWSDLHGLPQGFGATFGVQKVGNWFHLAIPTPSTISDAAVRLNRVMLLWDVLDTVGLPPNQIAVPIGPSSIHAWDGPFRLFAMDNGGGLPLKSGPGYAAQSNGTQGIIEGLTGWTVPGMPPVSFGLCLSVYICVSPGFNSNGERIRIIGAGAEFESP